VEFQRVYSRGIKVVGGFVVLFALPGEGTGCRLGITTTRKIGGAVKRNRSRRRLRELFRRHQEALPGIAVDLVINVRRGCNVARWDQLTEDYLRCLRRVQERLRSAAS
jgi:ribonuclease P protein component